MRIFNIKLRFEYPWKILNIRSWIFKSWNTIGPAPNHGITFHTGFRIIGIRIDRWIIVNYYDQVIQPK